MDIPKIADYPKIYASYDYMVEASRVKSVLPDSKKIPIMPDPKPIQNSVRELKKIADFPTISREEEIKRLDLTNEMEIRDGVNYLIKRNDIESASLVAGRQLTQDEMISGVLAPKVAPKVLDPLNPTDAQQILADKEQAKSTKAIAKEIAKELQNQIDKPEIERKLREKEADRKHEEDALKVHWVQGRILFEAQYYDQADEPSKKELIKFIQDNVSPVDWGTFKNKNAWKKDLYEHLVAYYELEINPTPMSSVAADDEEKKSGSGILGAGVLTKRKTKNDWIPFGRMALNIKELKHNNLVSICYPKTGNKVPGLKNEVVSDALKKVLLNPSKGNLDELDEDENKWFKKVLAKTHHEAKEVKKRNLTATIGFSKEALQKKFQITLQKVIAGDKASVEKIKELLQLMLSKKFKTAEEVADIESMLDP